MIAEKKLNIVNKNSLSFLSLSLSDGMSPHNYFPKLVEHRKTGCLKSPLKIAKIGSYLKL